MLEPEVMNKFWPPLVREVEQTVNYPGYRYQYFNSFKELDEHFTDLCGQDWIEQEWAKFWIGQHNLSRQAFRTEIEIRNGSRTPKPLVDYAVLRVLYAQAVDMGIKISVRGLLRFFAQHGQPVSVGTVFTFLRKIRKEDQSGALNTSRSKAADDT